MKTRSYMRMCHRLAPLLAAILTGLPAVSFSQTTEVTLEQAVELALRASPAVVQARGNVDIAGAGRREAVGNWLPTISGSGGWSANSTNRFDPNTQRTVSGSATSYSTSLSASMVIFDGFRRSATNRSADADITSANAALSDQRFEVVLATKRIFFNALAGMDLVRVAQTRIERSQRQLSITREKLAAGTAVRSDTLSSFVDFSNARLQLLNAETQLATATADLGRVMGIDGAIAVRESQATSVGMAVDTSGLRQEALLNSPSIRAAEAGVRAANAQLTVLRSLYFPSVSASYSQSWSGDALSNLSNSWSARVSVNWPIFNGFSREAGVSRSSANTDFARARQRDTRRRVNAELTRQFAALESARLRMDIANASHAAAEEELRVRQERYRLGVSTIVEVLVSQVSLDQSDVDFVQAKLDFFIAKAEIETLIGREI